ncbi:protein of unknown function [Taphrina deformans PYCC 5710]|uniref:Uncharacterized protein n=1 Tax=Taphrina deformans (strain PYCC 5710 / ATCC 11124 / CBS 356.35 / IMI 108563 / JCM 9778 / NBRC 8474) TaxID=1097556 RepID=R4X6K7_TAPDE|nr:protein of unknown function [Taphrina deformans PYCC 5710]|eukprot:CCG80770.1 protein of unknown function [Taphrina deformans PYCC 5710]
MAATFTKLFSFPNAPTENASHITTRIQNILQSPLISRYDVTYKLYRKQSEKLATLQFGSSPVLYCLCGSDVFELESEYENMLLKLKTWNLRQTTRIIGSVHEIEKAGLGTSGSRRVSVGVISQGPSTKGIVVDIQESYEDVLQAAMEVNENILHSIMGPIYNTLAIDLKTSQPLILSTGTGLLVDMPVNSGKMQTATSYFELFSKL